MAAAAQDEAARRGREIFHENKRLKDHPWAGEYYFGDGLGVNVQVALAPASGFVFSLSGCLGLYDQDYGDVSVNDAGVIHLNSKLKDVPRRFRGFDVDLQPVQWGDRRYLVPVKKLRQFCEEVNSAELQAPSWGGHYLLRREDRGLPIRGLPSVPADYLKYILPKPLEGKIIKVSGDEITVDLGAVQGVFSGMKLFIVDDSFNYQSITLTEVGERESRARGRARSTPLAVGQPLSTQSPLYKYLVEHAEKP